jgi:predicted esterase
MKETISVNLKYEHDVYIQKGHNSKKCFLLLHGYLLNADYIYNKLIPVIDENDLVIAPNGPFLIPVKKNETYKPKYSWYFFDSSKNTFYINFDPAVEYINQILNYYNTENLPVTIIGYSQGGYLAPKIAEVNETIRSVIGLACIFRNKNFKYNPRVRYHQIHGEDDMIVKKEESIIEWDLLTSKGNAGEFINLESSGHRIDDAFLDKLKYLIQL